MYPFDIFKALFSQRPSFTGMTRDFFVVHPQWLRKLIPGQCVTLRQGDTLHQDILQFTYITGPLIAFKCLQRPVGSGAGSGQR